MEWLEVISMYDVLQVSYPLVIHEEKFKIVFYSQACTENMCFCYLDDAKGNIKISPRL